MTDDEFLETLAFQMGALRLDVIYFGGALPREFMHALVNMMLSYTRRGFCGTFNARFSKVGEAAVWVSLRVIAGAAPQNGVV